MGNIQEPDVLPISFKPLCLAVAASKEAPQELHTILIQCTLMKVEFNLLL